MKPLAGLRPTLVDAGGPDLFDRAACKGADVSFFPDLEDSDEASERPKEVCRGCPVRSECLQFALDNSIKHGIWGATTPRDRRRIMRFRQERARRDR